MSSGRRDFLRMCGGILTAGFLGGCANSVKQPKSSTPKNSGPNVVIVFCDDMGYSDIGAFGAKGYKTPSIDSLATDGVKFNDFYVASSVCTPSRAALLTGCYPQRIGLPTVLNPTRDYGISSKELTLAEMLKQKNYATACVGKWHLGHQPQFLPTNHGFDQYFGLPYSNDMWPLHPTSGDKFPPLPLIEGEKAIEYNPDQSTLTRRYTEHAVNFIDKNADKPFFLYLAHSMVHVPLFVGEKFAGKSGQGLFADVMMEVDDSVRQVLKALKRNGVSDNTLVIFSSDNGPWLSYGTHAGSSGPLREGKGTSYEGGQRVSCLMRWPNHIPAATVSNEPIAAIDIMPTIAKLTEAKLSTNKIDGKDISDLMFAKPNAKSPHDAIYYYFVNELQAVRSGKWKLHLPHKYRTLNGRKGNTDGTPIKYNYPNTPLSLYDLSIDIGEKNNVADKHPDIVKRLKNLAQNMRKDLGDKLTNTTGTGRREPEKIA